MLSLVVYVAVLIVKAQRFYSTFHQKDVWLVLVFLFHLPGVTAAAIGQSFILLALMLFVMY